MRSKLNLAAIAVALSVISYPTVPAMARSLAPKAVGHHPWSKRLHWKSKKHHRWMKRHVKAKTLILMHYPLPDRAYGVPEGQAPADQINPTAPAAVLTPPTSPVQRIASSSSAPSMRLTAIPAIPYTPSPRASITASPTVPSTAPVAAAKSTRVSLEFVNTDIVQILRALALQTNTNIVAAPEVKGSLTVSLNDVDVEEALRMVTGMTGLAYTRIGSTILVAPHERIDAIRREVTGEAPAEMEAPVSEAYTVKGGKAEELVSAIAGKGQSSVGQVLLLATPSDSSSEQTIVLRGPKAQVAMIRKTLEQLDVSSELTAASYVIYDVKHLDPRALREDLIAAFPGLRANVIPGQVSSPGIYKPSQITKDATSAVADPNAKSEGGSPGGQSAGAGAAGAGGGGSTDVKSSDDNRSTRDTMGLTQPFQEYEKISVPMKLVLRGPKAQIDQALDYLSKIDIAPKQVALELRVMELTKDDALRIGLDWSILSGMGTVQALQLNETLGDTSSTAGVVSGTLTGPQSITATLDKSATNNNLIARPNLLAVDGRSAELFVGDVIRYIQTIQTSQNGTTVQTGEEHVGVRLAILPRISADNTIVMELRPIVTYLTGYTPVPGGGELPQTSERVEQTTAVMHDGDTIALGGLIQTQDEKTIGGIPFLKDLPIIGELFRRTTKDKQRTEIVFFLTAKIVDPHVTPAAADPREHDMPLAPVVKRRSRS
jgi:type II secretory pathway component GspD/PulD (secretin)